ncbi:MAG: hypothetical protein CMP10_09270 [Zetaproteobacteria bacterium]|nr:hypothetical protein [Pseudobdellovibrionaceae bacterium]
MKKLLLIVWIFLTPWYSYSLSFDEAIEKIKKHDRIRVFQNDADGLAAASNFAGSWEDPVIQIKAKNFPIVATDEYSSPMTGVEYSFAQKIPLSGKLEYAESALIDLSKSKVFLGNEQEKELYRLFWLAMIAERRLREEEKITKRNMIWIKKLLKVSEKLYSNGKVSQQVLLEQKIRRSELRAKLTNIDYSLDQIQIQYAYLLGAPDSSIDIGSIPWELLEQQDVEKKDNKELALQSSLKSKIQNLKSKKLAYIPDVQVSLGYTPKKEAAGSVDTITAMFALQIPIGEKKHASHQEAIYQKSQAAVTLNDYRRSKAQRIASLGFEIKKIKSDLDFLVKTTIPLAENSRAISSRSYALGQVNYYELLQTELKLQEILFKKINLKSKLAEIKLAYKFSNGERLYAQKK